MVAGDSTPQVGGGLEAIFKQGRAGAESASSMADSELAVSSAKRSDRFSKGVGMLCCVFFRGHRWHSIVVSVHTALKYDTMFGEGGPSLIPPKCPPLAVSWSEPPLPFCAMKQGTHQVSLRRHFFLAGPGWSQSFLPFRDLPTAIIPGMPCFCRRKSDGGASSSSIQRAPPSLYHQYTTLPIEI